MKTIENNILTQFASAEFIPSDEICSVILKAQEGDSVALNRIISSCQYLVLNVAKKSGILSYSKGYEDDVISSGNIGLLMAIRNFNVSKGMAFIPYAKVCINGAICDFLNSNHQIHYSKKVIQDLNKLSRKELEKSRMEWARKMAYTVYGSSDERKKATEVIGKNTKGSGINSLSNKAIKALDYKNQEKFADKLTKDVGKIYKNDKEYGEYINKINALLSSGVSYSIKDYIK